MKVRIVTKELDSSEETASGLFIPGQVEKAYKKVEVIRESFHRDLPKGLSKGDVVLVPASVGMQCEIDGDTVLIVDREHILVIT